MEITTRKQNMAESENDMKLSWIMGETDCYSCSKYTHKPYAAVMSYRCTMYIMIFWKVTTQKK